MKFQSTIKERLFALLFIVGKRELNFVFGVSRVVGNRFNWHTQLAYPNNEISIQKSPSTKPKKSFKRKHFSRKLPERVDFSRKKIYAPGKINKEKVSYNYQKKQIPKQKYSCTRLKN